MSHKKSKHKKKHLLPKVWRRVLACLGLVFALCAAAVLALPFALSSDFARAKIAQTLASATGKPASLDALSFSWSDGLRLEGLRIGQGELADETFLCALQRLRLDVGLLPLVRGRASLALEVQGLRLRLTLPTAAAKAPEPEARPLPEQLRGLFAALRAGLRPMRLPVDARIFVKLADSTVRLEQPAARRVIELRGLSCAIDAPSLKTDAVRVEASLEIFANGQSVAPVRLKATVERLADATGHLTPASASLTSALELPGTHITTTGSLATGFKASLRADLRAATNPLRPLFASPLPELSGTLALGLTLAQSGPDRLDAGLLVFVDDLRAAHGPLGGRSMGPLSLSLLQEAKLDCAAETVRLPGSLDLRAENKALWQGQLDGVKEGRPRLSLTVQPLRLDLRGVLAALKGLLPPGLSVGAASLTAQGLDLAAVLPEAPGAKPQFSASLDGLSFEARNIARRGAAGALTLGGLRLRLDKASASLSGNAPGATQASLALDLDGLRLDGKTPVSVQRLGAPRVTARLDQLALDPAALFGVTGQASVELSAEATGIEAKGKAVVPELTQELRLRADLPAAKAATASLDSLELSAPLVRVLRPGKAPAEAPLTLRLTAPDIRVTGPAPLTPAVRDANLGLDIGGALHCSARLSLTGPLADRGGRGVVSDGTLTLDAQKLLALAAAFAPKQAKATGGLSVDWKLAASLPDLAEPAKPGAPAKPEKLSQTLKRLGFLHEAEAVLALTNLSVDWPLAAAPGKPVEILRLRGINTPRPLRAATKDGLRESSLNGSVAFGPLDALPGLGRLERPLRGLLTVNAAQQGARSVQFSELLHLDGQDLDQNLTLTLDKLDTVLDRDADRLAATLEQVDASVGFSLTAALQSLPAKAAKDAATGFSGQGRLEAGAEARLAGGRSLAVSARFLSPGLDLSLGPDLNISGLTSSLRLSRQFVISPGLRCRNDGQADLPPLSEQVFDLFPASSLARRPATALTRLLAPDAPGAGDGVLRLAQARLKSGALPLELRDVELRLDTSGPVPGLRFFRVGLLGGNLLGSANIRKSGGLYNLNADCAFTGIDPARLLPAKASRDLGGQAETAGRVSLSLPLTPDPEVLLQRLNLRADITKIGPRTLERLLYALDPDEQNETIVQQRRLMGIGYPRFLHLGVAYGNLSLSGAVEVKGIQLGLPQVDRLSVGNLPLRAKLGKPLAIVPRLVKLLDAISGSFICRDPSELTGAPAGALRVVEPAPSQGVSP